MQLLERPSPALVRGTGPTLQQLGGCGTALGCDSGSNAGGEPESGRNSSGWCWKTVISSSPEARGQGGGGGERMGLPRPDPMTSGH